MKPVPIQPAHRVAPTAQPSNLPTKRYRIFVTVCTRRRPKMLERFLNSFLALQNPDDADVVLLVVENDTNNSMQRLVETKQLTSQNKIIYFWESKLGIPIARNRCIEIAAKNNATHIAFIDDDEWLSTDWLVKMWRYINSLESNHVIQGPVVSIMPSSSPEHLASFFQRRIKETGTELGTCATNNLLAPIDIFDRYNLRFDESQPLAGGTDSKVFSMAKSKGVKLVYCSDALVYESVPPERANLTWLTHRHFRVGLNMGERRMPEGFIANTGYFLAQLLRTTLRLNKTVFYYASGNNTKQTEYWLKTCATFGSALAPLGLKIDSYTKTDGS
ncbi:MAG: glycosyltransferase family 2 protein [Pseudomonadales bacterium]|nr:glycosyltransferase family 2 protein [Pseudomonadales bacterium]